jgi:prepilin-type N-terminal cleavage/methylation domain-containing protein
MTALPYRKSKGFTLIELLIVIAIIGILMALLFPAVTGAINAAKKAQAQNDSAQLAVAAQAFFTEYGKHALQWQWDDEDWTFDSGNPNKTLMEILTATGAQATNNPRMIVFLETKTAKKSGTNWVNGIAPDGNFYDPWGTPYYIRIDCNYNNQVRSPYTDSEIIRKTALAWSAGPDKQHKYNAPGDKVNKDNVTSW